jgi:hypothetical protein
MKRQAQEGWLTDEGDRNIGAFGLSGVICLKEVVTVNRCLVWILATPDASRSPNEIRTGIVDSDIHARYLLNPCWRGPPSRKRV